MARSRSRAAASKRPPPVASPLVAAGRTDARIERVDGPDGSRWYAAILGLREIARFEYREDALAFVEVVSLNELPDLAAAARKASAALHETCTARENEVGLVADAARELHSGIELASEDLGNIIARLSPSTERDEWFKPKPFAEGELLETLAALRASIDKLKVSAREKVRNLASSIHEEWKLTDETKDLAQTCECIAEEVESVSRKLARPNAR